MTDVLETREIEVFLTLGRRTALRQVCATAAGDYLARQPDGAAHRAQGRQASASQPVRTLRADFTTTVPGELSFATIQAFDASCPGCRVIRCVLPMGEFLVAMSNDGGLRDG